jgi:hypothetical protein
MHPFPLFKLRREFRRRSSVGTGEAMISISGADGPGAYGAGFALGVSLWYRYFFHLTKRVLGGQNEKGTGHGRLPSRFSAL